MKQALRKMCVVLISFVMVLSFTASGFAKTSMDTTTSYGVTLYTDGNGLPTGEANAVLQTQNGYIWMGGYGGLQRFDGRNYVQFGEEDGLSSYSVRSLWEAPDGIMWVGSNEQGAFFYDGNTFTHVDSSYTKKYLSVRCFEQDQTGRVWVGASEGLCYIEDNRIQPFDLEEYGYSNSTVCSLDIDESGTLWACDYNGCIFSIDVSKMKLKKYYAPGDVWPEGVYAYCLILGNDGKLYVGTNESTIIRITNPNGKAKGTVIDSGSLYCINAATKTEGGELWFVGDSGVGMIDASGKYHDLSFLEHTSHLTCVIEDYEHNIWAASNKFGVLNIYRMKMSQLAVPGELKDLETLAVCECDGRNYVAAENGVYVYDLHWNRVESKVYDELKGIEVRDIIKTDKGKLYFATYYHGIYVYSPKKDKLKNIPIDAIRTRVLLELEDGRIAVGTNVGIDFLEKDKVVESIPVPSMILCMTETDKGDILIGTDGGGIFRYDGRNVISYADTNAGLSGGVILRIEKDQKAAGKYFVSCGYELFYGDRDKFYRTAKIEQGNGSILDIFSVGDDVWIFRSSGVLKVNRDELIAPCVPGGAEDEAAETLTDVLYLTAEDGIPGPIVANSWSKFDGNQFCICTSNGIGILDIANLFKNNVVPKAIISNVIMSDGTVWDRTNEIDLGKDLSKLSVEFVSPTFNDDNVQATFWLEGLDEEPITRAIDDQHEVEYTNLKAGNYTFHFYVTNSEGIQSEEQTLILNKTPKFTETIWFPLLLAAIIGGIIMLVANYRIKRARRKQEEYREITDQTIATMSGAIDAKDPYTEGHSKRVAEVSVEIGKKIGLKDEDIERLRYIALLHDIGKIGVPDEILKKPERLSDEEFIVIKKHTTAGGEILSKFTMLPGVAEGAMYHHERYDGSGYCYGLKGEDIPLFARIISIADAYDAMNSSRCYRKALDKSIITAEIEKGKGSQFDPELADVALELIKEDVI